MHYGPLKASRQTNLFLFHLGNVCEDAPTEAAVTYNERQEATNQSRLYAAISLG